MIGDTPRSELPWPGRPRCPLARSARFAPLGLAFALLAGPAAAETFDVLLRGGTVIDGTGAQPSRTDVGVRDGRIAAVGDLSADTAAKTIDAAGLYVTPGFIDMHSHAEVGLSDPYLATAANNLLQGITTVVVGQDGHHAWPLGGSFRDQVALLRRQGIGNNMIPLVGQGAARLEVMGFSKEVETPEQTSAIEDRIDELLREGAWGLSSGLGYEPGRYSPPDEVVTESSPLQRYGGFYTSHLRDQADGFLESVEETIRLSRQSRVPVVVTHIKVAARRNWGKAKEAVAIIEKARSEGLPIYADLYPYDSSADGLNFPLVPAQALFTGDELRLLLVPSGTEPIEILRWVYRRDPSLRAQINEDFLARHIDFVTGPSPSMSRSIERQPIFRRRLRDVMAEEDSRSKLLALVEQRIAAPGGADLYRVSFHPDESLIGLSVSDAARNRGVSEAEAAVELTLEGARFLQTQLSELDIITFLKQPWVAGGTDGGIPEYGDVDTHPRSYGSFIRRIHRYAFELGIVELPFAIHTATGLPAEIIGISDRGLLKRGQWADVIAFDPKRLADRATYKDPQRFSDGIDWVLVNGRVVVENGKVTGERAGKVLLKTEVRNQGGVAR